MSGLMNLSKEKIPAILECPLQPFDEYNYAKYETACRKAAELKVDCVYVTPMILNKLSDYSKKLLKDSGVKIGTCVQDAFGSLSTITWTPTEELKEETESIAKDGCDVLVMNLSSVSLIDHNEELLKNNINAFVSTCHEHKVEARIQIPIDKIGEENWEYAFSLIKDGDADEVLVGSYIVPTYSCPNVLDMIKIREIADKYIPHTPISAMNIWFETTAYVLLQTGADKIFVCDNIHNAENIIGKFDEIRDIFIGK